MHLILIKLKALSVLQPNQMICIWKFKKRHQPFDIVRAGDHWERRISKHMLPLLCMLGW